MPTNKEKEKETKEVYNLLRSADLRPANLHLPPKERGNEPWRRYKGAKWFGKFRNKKIKR